MPTVSGVFITWQAHFSGQQVVAGGDGVADGGVVLVNFSGTGAQAGTLLFVTVTHAADGTSVRWDGPANSAHPAALVFAVTPLANPPPVGAAAAVAASSSSGPSGSHVPWWAVAVAAVGGLALLGCVLTGRRRRKA